MFDSFCFTKSLQDLQVYKNFLCFTKAAHGYRFLACNMFLCLDLGSYVFVDFGENWNLLHNNCIYSFVFGFQIFHFWHLDRCLTLFQCFLRTILYQKISFKTSQLSEHSACCFWLFVFFWAMKDSSPSSRCLLKVILLALICHSTSLL